MTSNRSNHFMAGLEIARLCRAAMGGYLVEPPPLDSDLAPALRAGGVLGLAARSLPESSRLAGLAKEQLWRQHVQSMMFAGELQKILAEMRVRGVSPVLLKGLSAARHYRTVADRGFGDIDLLVPDHQCSEATAALGAAGYSVADRETHALGTSIDFVGSFMQVDLHTALRRLTRRDSMDAVSSIEELSLDPCGSVRILPPELELRYMAVHAAAHGFSRAVWLCDIASLVRRETQLDWTRVLEGPWRARSRVEAALALSADLLEASLPEPVNRRAHGGARRLRAEVLRVWGRGGLSEHPGRRSELVASAIRSRDARAAVFALASSWPTTLEAVSEIDLPLHSTLIPAHVAVCAGRRFWYLTQRWGEFASK